MTIRSKFILIFGQLLFVGTCLASLSLFLSSYLGREFSALESEDISQVLVAKNNLDAFENYTKEVEVALSTGELHHLDEYKYLLNDIMSRSEDVDLNGQIRRFEGQVGRFTARALGAPENDLEEMVRLAEPLSKQRGALLKLLNDKYQRSKEALSHRLRHIETISDTIGIVMPFVIFMGVVTSLIFAYFVIRPVLRRLESLRDHFAQSSLEDLSPIDTEDSLTNDELDALVLASNQMLRGFKEARSGLVSKRFVDKIFLTLSDPLLVTDLEGKIIHCNPAANNAISVPIGRKFVELLDGKDPIRDEFRNINGATSHAAETSMLLWNRDHEVIITWSAINIDGEFEGLVIVIKDVSKLKRSEAETKKVQAQLMQASKLASIGTLGAGVAHELNNPLVGVLGFAELILSDPDSSELSRKHAERIIKASERMRKIVDHLRSFATDTGSRELEAVDIEEPIRDALILLEKQLGLASIEVRLDLPEGLPPVLGDANQLESVFSNLISNSRDAFKNRPDQSDKYVKLRARQDNGCIVIRYEDNAGGIPKDIRGRIFDPFFTTKEVGEGTGIGLSISFSILRDHGGQLELLEAPAGYTRFQVSIPIAKTSVRPKLKRVSTEQPTSPAQFPGAKILVVDDEQVVLDVVSQFLAQDFQVTAISDPAEALELLNKESFDLLLTDLKMPKMSGSELMGRVLENHPKQKVAVMTGHALSFVAKEKLSKEGADIVIAKPFRSAHELRESLIEVILRNSDGQGLEPPAEPGRQRVLIVDDETAILDVVKMCLETDYDVVAEADAIAARDRLKKESFDLVLSDLSMPGCSGEELLKIAKETNPDGIFAFMTGYSRNSDVARSLLANGADEIFEKPFRFGQLKSQLASLLAHAVKKPA